MTRARILSPIAREHAFTLGNAANRFLFENERVRVWQMDLAPGESSDFHEHTLPSVSAAA